MVPTERGVLTWKQLDKCSLTSTCGKWSVAKIGSGSGRFTYEAWRRAAHPLGRLQLATNLPDAMTARLRCEADDE